jgi:hypothetical protein
MADLLHSCVRSPITVESITSGASEFSEDESNSVQEWLIKADAYFSSVEDEVIDTDDNSEYTENISYQGVSNMRFSENVATALGLSHGATEGDVIQAIGAIKASTFSETERNALLEIGMKQRILEFQEYTGQLDVIPGTATELAEKLYNMEIAVSPEAATERLQEWQHMQSMIDNAGVTKTVLSANHSEDVTGVGPAQAKVQQYAEENKVDFPVAVVHFAQNDKAVFNAYRQEINQG